MRKLKVDY